MTRRGTLSASQIVATFRYDFAVQRLELPWPEMPADPIEARKVPVHRLQQILSARGPWALYFILECAWHAYDCGSAELATMRAYQREEAGRLTVGEFYMSFKRNPLNVTDTEGIKRISRLRQSIRSGDFSEGVFVAVTGDAARLIYPAAPPESFCLLDGHHRFIALSEEARWPDSVMVCVGSIPETRCGLTTINGAA